MYLADMVIQNNYNSSVAGRSFPSELGEQSREHSPIMDIPGQLSSTMEGGKETKLNNLKRKGNSDGKESSVKLRVLSGISSSCYSPTPTADALYSGGTTTGVKVSPSSVGGTTQSNKISSSGKKKKIDLTLDWLEENYTICEGVCLARCILYSHYKDFCEKNELEPSCAATFGKTIRQKFPRVTTRRLGMRGHSKYHYYGIGIRETSVYYNSVYADRGLTRYSAKGKMEDEPYSASKTKATKENLQETFLDEVPDVNMFSSEVGNSSSLEQVQILISVYKSLCQQTLAAGQNRDYKLVSHNLLQCWSDAPFQQFPNLFHSSLAIDLATLCDVLLYEALIEVLLPLPCDDIEDRILSEIGSLGKQWEEFLKSAISSSVYSLLAKKKSLAQQFSQYLMRHVSYIKLNRAVKSIFGSAATFLPMRNDLEKINLNNTIGSPALYSATSEETKDSSISDELLKELKDLLKKNATVEMLVEWLDSVVDAKVIKPSKQNGRSLKKRAHDFFLKWSFFGARITHNLNNTNASSFNSFHYLRMFLVEYVMLTIETQFSSDKRLEARKAVAKHAKSSKVNLQTNQSTKTSTSAYYSDANFKGEYKSGFTGGEAPKGWDSHDYCLPHFPGYETRSKTEFSLESNPQSHFDSQASIIHRSHPSQNNTNNHSSLLYSAGYESSITSSSFLPKRNETVVYENGSSFMYLNGTTKPETYSNFYYADNFYSSNPSQRSSSSHSSGEIPFSNSVTLDNKRLNPESYLAPGIHLTPTSSSLEKSSPLSGYKTKMEQSSPGFSEFIPSTLNCLPNRSINSSLKDAQELNYSPYPGNDQNSLDDSQTKGELRSMQNGFRIFEELYPPTPAPTNSFTPIHSYDDSFLHNNNYYDVKQANYHDCLSEPSSKGNSSKVLFPSAQHTWLSRDSNSQLKNNITVPTIVEQRTLCDRNSSWKALSCVIQYKSLQFSNTPYTFSFTIAGAAVGLSWNGHVSAHYEEGAQINSISSDNVSQRMLYQENLPSIASVLSTE